MKMKPLLIIISGAPGSGKSTFARNLAEHMRLLCVERDLAFDGMRHTFAPEPFDRQKDGLTRFYGFIEAGLKLQIGMVVDGTLYRGKSEHFITPLAEFATVINVHTRATNERQRFYDREVAKTQGKETEWLKGHMAVIDEIYQLVVDPLELGCPVIEVATTDDYQPSLEKVAEEIMRLVAVHSAE